MKEEKSFRAFSCDTVSLWETLHYLHIPVSATINPDFLEDNAVLTPENILIIIGRAPPGKKVRHREDSVQPGNMSAPVSTNQSISI